MNKNVGTKDHALESLKRSATFSMSRGSRELFHTNFLAFILEAEGSGYVKEVKKEIIKSFFDEPYPDNVICFRERSNLDLIMIPALEKNTGESQVIVIEAKLKSTPTMDQLRKYTDKLNSGLDLELFEAVEFQINERTIAVEKLSLNNSHLKLYSKPSTRSKLEKTINIKLKKVLLAPESFKNTVNDWVYESWEEFLTCLEKIDFKAEPDDLLSRLLNDYVTSTRQILNLIGMASSKIEEFKSNKLGLDDFLQWVMGNDFRNARLHDLIGKVTFYQLQNKLLEDVSKKIGHITDLTFQLEGITFFSRSMPGLEIHLINITNKYMCKIGVQIQGDNYRHFISRDNSVQKPILIDCANKVEDWMKSVCKNKFDDKNLEKKDKNNGFGVFNKDLFVHLSAHMINDIGLRKYDDLVNKIVESMKSAIRKLECTDFNDALIGNETNHPA